ncbi:MAG: right-handed parallel beta-helix repeat-containing protein [Flavitalea sp.]
MKNKLIHFSQLRPLICKTCLLLTLAAIAFSCKKDVQSSVTSTENVVSSNLSATAYDVTLSLPTGYVKDGSVDYTKYLQMAIDKYDNLNFPAFPILVNDIGLQLRSNSKLTFATGSKLILKPSKNQNYDVLSIRECNNVKIYSPVIVGDRNSHTGSGGEWGMGIGIYSSSNIQVSYAVISNTWGDGIYVGSSAKNIPSSAIIIDRVNITNSRRSAISITSAKGVTITNSYLAKSNGTIPQDGICVEPNSSKDEISGLVFTNIQSFQNKGHGIEFSLSKIYGGSDKKIDAVINSYVDKGSYSAVYVSCFHKKSSHGEKVSGLITFNNPKWYNFGQYVFDPYGLQEPALSLKVVNPSLYDSNNNLLDQAAILKILQREIYSKTNTTIVNN